MKTDLFNRFQKDRCDLLVSVGIGSILFGIIKTVSGYYYQFSHPIPLFQLITGNIAAGIAMGAILGLLFREKEKIPRLIVMGFCGGLVNVILVSIWYTDFLMHCSQ